MIERVKAHVKGSCIIEDEWISVSTNLVLVVAKHSSVLSDCLMLTQTSFGDS